MDNASTGVTMNGHIKRLVGAVDAARESGYSPCAIRLTEETWRTLRDELIAAGSSTFVYEPSPDRQPQPDQIGWFYGLPMFRYTDVDRITCDDGSIAVDRLTRAA